MTLPRLTLLAVIGLLLGIPQARALERIELTPEAKQRCDGFATESGKKLCQDAFSVRDLVLPTEAVESVQSAPQMGLYKPPGAGPFPAIVLMHTCAGITVNEQLPEWARLALARGYVVFVLDSFTQRGVGADGACEQPASTVMHNARVRDASRALVHLASFPFVDKSRIAAMGFSQGARIAYLLSSDHFAKPFSQGMRFAALVSLYGECFATQEKFSFIQPDMSVPVLALLGDKDNDGKVTECLPRFQQVKAKGAPVEWHVFEGVGHAFDMPSLVPPQRVSFSEPPFWVMHGYDAKATDQSHELAFGFLSRVMK